MLASEQKNNPAKVSTTPSIEQPEMKLLKLPEIPGIGTATKLPELPAPSKNSSGILLVRQVTPSKTEEVHPSVIVDSDVPKEKREQVKKNCDAAIKEILRLNPDAKEAYKADSVKVLVVGDVKGAWRSVASRTGQNPIAGDDLCAFTLTLGDKDAKPLKLESIIILDKSVLDSVPHGIEVINHELRHVIDNNDKAAKGGGFGTKTDRESYAYSKTVEDLTKVRDAWKKEGRDSADIKILEERIKAQEKLAEEYKKK